jgi:hypothetical protein
VDAGDDRVCHIYEHPTANNVALQWPFLKTDFIGLIADEFADISESPIDQKR